MTLLSFNDDVNLNDVEFEIFYIFLNTKLLFT